MTATVPPEVVEPGPPGLDRLTPLEGPARIDADADADAALAQAFSDHYARLVQLARVLVDHHASAEEVVQEAFVRTFVRIRRVRNDDLYPYLRTTVLNLARGRLRTRRIRRGLRPESPRIARSPEIFICDQETRAELALALERLSRRQREVVVLRYLECCSTRETAEVLGLSEGSVKTHLSRGLAELREAGVEVVT